MTAIGSMRYGRMWAAIAAVLAFAPVPWAAAQSRTVVREIGVAGGGAYLGIEMEEVTAENMAAYKLNAERGVIVRSVEKGSPAEEAGILQKDVILELSGAPVLSTQQFARMVREMPPGRRADLVVSRDGKRLNLTAKLGKREGDALGSMVIRPREQAGRPFEFESPGGRTFRFAVPEGREFRFGAPGGSAMIWDAEPKPRLGVTLQDLTPQMAEYLGIPGRKGVLVTGTVAGTPAASALKAGDVITHVGDAGVESPDALSRAIRGKEGKIDLRVVRDKKELAIQVELKPAESKPRGFTL